jgi:hypothetical protein
MVLFSLAILGWLCFMADIPSAHYRTFSVFLPGLIIHYRMTEAADFHNDPNQGYTDHPCGTLLVSLDSPSGAESDTVRFSSFPVQELELE